MLWMEKTWTELNPAETVAILPVGAVEAHGPHLPLGTDVIIAQGMARLAVARLSVPCLILPPLAFTVAGFAGGFAGTLNFRPSTVAAMIADLLDNLAAQKWRLLAIANAHLDPGHVACLRDALGETPLPVAYPDITRRKLAARLSEEFQSGACHAGQYEGSIVLAERPDLVRPHAHLPDNPRSLVEAIQAGHKTFQEAGGPQAYFGFPARSSAEEGRASLEILGAILAEAIQEKLAR